MTNPFSKLKHSPKEILSGIILAMFGLWFLWAILIGTPNRNKRMREFGRYTIATTGRTYFKPKSVRQVRYHHYVNGKRFEDGFDLSDYVRPHGKKYLVRFNSKDPSMSEIVYIKPVPEQFHNPPPEGWENPPYYDTNVTLDNSKVGAMPTSCAIRKWLGHECPKCISR